MFQKRIKKELIHRQYGIIHSEKKIVVIIGLIIGLSIIALSTIQSISEINEDVIIVNNKNLEIFYFNNLDPENPYNQDFSILSDKQINQLKKNLSKGRF